MLSRADFDEPEAITDLSWNPSFQLYPLGGAPFHGTWLGYRFGCAWVQEIRTSQDCVASFRVPADRVSIIFSPTNSMEPGPIGSGTAIARPDDDADSTGGFYCFKAPSCWAELSFPHDDGLNTKSDEAGKGAAFLAAEAEVGACLRLLHELAVGAAGGGIDTASSRATQGWESAFLLTGARFLESARQADDGALRRRAHVLSRFAHFLEDNPGELIQLTDLCSAIGVNARTFRLYCEQSLGMGPTRFMRLRRMHQAHRALRDGTGRTVMGVACDFGFYEAGRFSAEYVRMFGEYPSSTIRRARAEEQAEA